MLQLLNVTKLYTNTATANFRPVVNVFDNSKDFIAALNHIRCTVPKYATPAGYQVCAEGRFQRIWKCENVFNCQIVINCFPRK